MNVEKVESLLERSRPSPPPPELRRRILEAAALKAPPVSAPPRKPRFVEVMTMAASILMLIGTLSWLLRGAPDPKPAAVQEGQPFEERRLMEEFPHGLVSDFTWSADGKQWACVALLGTPDAPRSCAVVNGKPEKEYANVSLPKFGRDGRYAYVAYDAKLDRWILVVDGTAQTQFDSCVEFAWSPDGRKLALAVQVGERMAVIEDGRRSELHDSVTELMWSAGGRLAYVAKAQRDYFTVVDGKRGEPFDHVRSLRFGPDGRTPAYAAQEGKWLVVVGETKGPEFPSVGFPVFSPDGKTVGYPASNGTKSWMVVQPPEPGAPPTCDNVDGLMFSRDGKTWAYRSTMRKRQQIVVSRVKTSAEKSHRADVGGELYDSVSEPVLNADGSVVAYAAGKGSRRYLVVGEKATVKFSLIDRISFAPDQKTLAYRAGQYGKQFVIAGERRSDEFDEVVSGPVWSADGKKVAFTARNNAELWSRVIDVK